MIAESHPDWILDKQFSRFMNYVAQRRMSKEGRFLRVHFKTGGIVELVPEGSLATGLEMVVGRKRKVSHRFVRPGIDQMWKEFTKKVRADARQR